MREEEGREGVLLGERGKGGESGCVGKGMLVCLYERKVDSVPIANDVMMRDDHMRRIQDIFHKHIPSIRNISEVPVNLGDSAFVNRVGQFFDESWLFQRCFDRHIRSRSTWTKSWVRRECFDRMCE